MSSSKLKLYNTLTRKIEEFRPLDPENVKVYTCGPTVYSTPHIGNFASYVYWDLLVRILQANNYQVNRVLNLTDVGHLVSDSDEGEDKLEKGARQTGKSVWDVAKFYSDEFLTTFRALKMIEPTKIAPATNYIKADMKVVDLLTQKGYTYETKDGIYYDTSKFPHYADFAKLDLDQLKAGARVEFSQEKRNLADFAVWKFIQPGEKHEMRWDYLGRPGYPGWHLECSTIIHEELGEPIDIHTGGIDHIPVHHTNEIAQSEAAFGQQLSRFWLHCNHLISEGAKLSKSLGNGYTIPELIAKGYQPLDFKMWVLQGHYRSERNFSMEGLESARIRRLNWRNRVAKCRQGVEDLSQAGTDGAIDLLIHGMNDGETRDGLNDDLNSAAALATIDGILETNLEFWLRVENLFGLGLLDDPTPSHEIQKLLAERAEARQAKDFARSDQLRDELAKKGFSVLDAPTGQYWQYLR